MEIRRLPPGEMAPPDTDCVKITALMGGRFTLATSALLQCAGDDEAMSEAVISSDEYESYADAEQAGLAWAEERCVETVYVETE